MSDLVSLKAVVETHAAALDPEQQAALVSALVDREDSMADMFRMAGAQFGLYPQIVAEVFAEVGIGTPVDDVQRQFIRAQFNALMQQLQQQFGEGPQG